MGKRDAIVRLALTSVFAETEEGKSLLFAGQYCHNIKASSAWFTSTKRTPGWRFRWNATFTNSHCFVINIISTRWPIYKIIQPFSVETIGVV